MAADKAAPTAAERQLVARLEEMDAERQLLQAGVEASARQLSELREVLVQGQVDPIEALDEIRRAWSRNLVHGVVSGAKNFRPKNENRRSRNPQDPG